MKKLSLPILVSLFALVFSPVNAAEPAPAEEPVPAEEGGKEKIEVAIDSPATNYRIQIQEIRKVGEELWVLSQVSKVGDFGGQAITTVKDAVEIPVSGLAVKHFVAGKSWGWGEPKTVTYLPDGEGMTDEKWDDGEVVWTLPKEGGDAEEKG